MIDTAYCDAADTTGAVFAESLAEIVSTCAGFDMEIAPSSESAEIDGSFFGLIGIMSLSGAMSGVLTVSANESDLRRAYAFMTGKQPEDASSEDVHDTLCEFVNMTAGVAKARLGSEDEPFALSAPFIIKSDDSGCGMTLIKKKRAPMSSYVIRGLPPDGTTAVSLKLKLLRL